MPRQNIFWDFDYTFGTWVEDLRQEYIAAYDFYKGELPIGEAWKLNPPTNKSPIFRFHHKYANQLLGWRVLETRRHFENINGEFQGDLFFDPSHIYETFLTPLLGWLWYRMDRARSSGEYHRTYIDHRWPSSQPSGLSPVELTPYYPYQSFYTEVRP